MIYRTELGGNKPFMLQSVYKDYIWGGSKLKDEYGKETETNPLAEAWVCSTHPDGQSIVASGEFAGLALGEVISLHPEYLGTHPRAKAELPILVKLIDAKKDLSVQVHPDDEYARVYENGQLGKTEMWYVLHADMGAELVYGFRHDISKAEVRKSIKNGSIEQHLQYVPVQKDDVFMIEAGTVHAIGKGVVIAEIQESSNLTYRLFDYDRLDKKGRKRELHIDKALDVAKLSSSIEPRQPMRVLNYRKGYASELLGRCKYLQVERLLLNTERCRNMADFQTRSNSFRVLLCVDGCGIVSGESVMINFFKGDCIFVPALSIPLKMHGMAQILNIGC